MSQAAQIDVDSFRVTPTGFTCNRDGQSRSFNDGDVVAIRVRRERLSHSDAPRTRELLSIRLADPEFGPIEVDAEYSGPEDNFLSPFRDRLLDELARRAMAILLGKDTFDGGPWTIGLDGLTEKASGRQIPLDEVAAAAWQRGQLCFWRHGSDQAMIGLPADGENTLLLERLADKLLGLSAREGPTVDGQPSTDRYEFHDSSMPSQMVLGAIGGLGLCVIVVALKLGMAGQPIFLVAAAIEAIMTLAALGLVYWKFGGPATLLLADASLALSRRGHETVVPLAELAQFSAHWTDLYTNGVYQTTRICFRFASDDASAQPIDYDAQATYETPKYEALQRFQAHVAGVVARRMQGELAAAGRALWTARLTLLPDAIEFAGKPGEPPRVIAPSEITHWEVDQGLLKIAIDGSRRPNIVEKTSQPNFYPGLVLFRQLLEQFQSTADDPAAPRKRAI